MSSIQVIKGLPISLLVGVTESNVAVNVTNTDVWSTTIELRHKTTTGESPFALTTSPSGNSFLVEITGEQTESLDHRDYTYVLVIKADKLDDTVHLRNSVVVSVVDDI